MPTPTSARSASGAASDVVAPEPLLVPARDGERRTLLGDIIMTTVGAEQTGGQFSLIGNAGPRLPRPIPMHHHSTSTRCSCRSGVRCSCGSTVRAACSVLATSAASLPAPSMPTSSSHRITSSSATRCREASSGCSGSPASRAKGYVHPPAGASGRPPFERFKQAEIKMHMKYVDDPHVEATYGPDDRLPGNAHPYFLKSGEGQRVLLADQLFTFLMRGEEIARQAAIFHAQGPKGAACPTHVHADASVGIWVLDGRLLLTLDGEEHVLIPGDFAYAPPGCPWSYTMDSHFTQIHAIVTPAGFERLIARAGEPYPYYVFPTHVVSPPSLDVLSEAAQGLDIQFLR